MKGRWQVETIQYRFSKEIDKDQVISLYEDAGWTSYTKDPEKLMKALYHSLMVISAWDNERLVGLIRAVGDGLVILYIQDILVLNDYKRKGIGKTLMNYIFNKHKEVRQKVLLTEDSKETRGFYESMGFKSCDDGITVAFAIQE